MIDYEKIISPKRFAVPTPERIVENGQSVFGTFDKEFKELNLIEAAKPTCFPNFLNRFRLSLWEAVEVHLKEGLLLTAACDMGIFGTNLTVFYDKTTKKARGWFYNTSSSKVTISPNLLDGAVTEVTTSKTHLKYVNNFQDGKASFEGSASDKKAGSIEYAFDLERVSLPSVVSIPFGKNQALYTQKDLFKVSGSLKIDGKEYFADSDTAAIIDDHRGYYPYKMHYDWISTMGKNPLDKDKYFGFNLTRNQSLQQDDYNENIVWLEGDTALLPPVTFTHLAEDKWLVKDEHGLVELTYDIKDRFSVLMHYGVIDTTYHIPFGELSGFIINGKTGEKYILDGVTAIGEDKSMRF